MSEQQGSSFIPKSGVRTIRKTGATRRIYLLAYISYIVFFTTLFVVVGVYVYSITVNRSLSAVQNQLTTERQRFAVSEVEQIWQLDSRIKEAERILNESTAPSRIFSDIETIVASNIHFTGVSYELLPSQQFELELTGSADDFNEILAQRDLLKDSAILKNAVVSSYDYSVAGENDTKVPTGEATLSFTFKDKRDISLIPYTPGVQGSTNIISSENQETPPADTEESVTIVEPEFEGEVLPEEQDETTSTTTESGNN